MEILVGVKFRNAYIRFLTEHNERKRNAFFSAMMPTINRQVTSVFIYLKITDKDLQIELRQLAHIKILDKLTFDKIGGIKNLNGYIRTIIINTIRDYFTLSNIYNKHRREYKLLVSKRIETYGRSTIMKSTETPQSELLIKPTIK